MSYKLETLSFKIIISFNFRSASVIMPRWLIAISIPSTITRPCLATRNVLLIILSRIPRIITFTRVSPLWPTSHVTICPTPRFTAISSVSIPCTNSKSWLIPVLTSVAAPLRNWMWPFLTIYPIWLANTRKWPTPLWLILSIRNQRRRHQLLAIKLKRPRVEMALCDPKTATSPSSH